MSRPLVLKLKRLHIEDNSRGYTMVLLFCASAVQHVETYFFGKEYMIEQKLLQVCIRMCSRSLVFNVQFIFYFLRSAKGLSICASV